jgi:hypothetical protein
LGNVEARIAKVAAADSVGIVAGDAANDLWGLGQPSVQFVVPLAAQV